MKNRFFSAQKPIVYLRVTYFRPSFWLSRRPAFDLPFPDSIIFRGLEACSGSSLHNASLCVMLRCEERKCFFKGVFSCVRLSRRNFLQGHTKLPFYRTQWHSFKLRKGLQHVECSILAAQSSHRKIAATTVAASGLATIPLQKSQVFFLSCHTNIRSAPSRRTKQRLHKLHNAQRINHNGVRIWVGLFLFGARRRGLGGANLCMFLLVFLGRLVQFGEYLEVPRVRLSISGVKSGTIQKHLKTAPRSNSEFPGFVLLEISFRIVLPPKQLVPFSSSTGTLHGTARAGHQILSSAGATSEIPPLPNALNWPNCISELLCLFVFPRN